MKTNMSECLVSADSVSECTESGAGIDGLGIEGVSNYIQGVTVVQPENVVRSTGQTLFLINLNWGALGGVGSGDLTFTAVFCDGAVAWECGLSVAEDAKYVPSSCRKTSAEALQIISC